MDAELQGAAGERERLCRAFTNGSGALLGGEEVKTRGDARDEDIGIGVVG